MRKSTNTNEKDRKYCHTGPKFIWNQWFIICVYVWVIKYSPRGTEAHMYIFIETGFYSKSETKLAQDWFYLILSLQKQEAGHQEATILWAQPYFCARSGQLRYLSKDSQGLAGRDGRTEKVNVFKIPKVTPQITRCAWSNFVLFSQNLIFSQISFNIEVFVFVFELISFGIRCIFTLQIRYLLHSLSSHESGQSAQEGPFL